MSEAMLTRDEVEHLLTMAKIDEDEELTALCTMALSSIAMREALKPFADESKTWNFYGGPANETLMVVKISDLRRAAEAYQEQGK